MNQPVDVADIQITEGIIIKTKIAEGIFKLSFTHSRKFWRGFQGR